MSPSDPDVATSHAGKRPALMVYEYHVQSDRVGLIDLSGQRLLEPFFVQSVGTLAQGPPAPLEIAGDRTAVRSMAAALSEPSPIPCGGQIYHTGRCGSTLLANALSALDSLLVLKEPPFAQQVSADLLVYATVDPEVLRRRATDICDHLVPSTRAQSSYLLKFTSWNTLCAEHWQRVLHRSPVIFLWRRARDVLESVARNPSGWIVGEEGTISPEQLTGRWTQTLDPRIPYPLAGALEVWRSVAEAGLRLAAAGALVWSTTGSPRTSLRRSARWWTIWRFPSAPPTSPARSLRSDATPKTRPDPGRRWPSGRTRSTRRSSGSSRE